MNARKLQSMQALKSLFLEISLETLHAMQRMLLQLNATLMKILDLMKQ